MVPKMIVPEFDDAPWSIVHMHQSGDLIVNDDMDIVGVFNDDRPLDRDFTIAIRLQKSNCMAETVAIYALKYMPPGWTTLLWNIRPITRITGYVENRGDRHKQYLKVNGNIIGDEFL